MTARFIVIVGATLLALGCKKDEPPPPSEPPPAEEPAPAASAAPAEPELDPTTLPTVEEFEAEAEEKVTAATLDQELDRLEKEIQAD